MSNHNLVTKDYFKQKAAEYDNVDNQLYWVLSDNFYKGTASIDLFRHPHPEGGYFSA